MVNMDPAETSPSRDSIVVARPVLGPPGLRALSRPSKALDLSALTGREAALDLGLVVLVAILARFAPELVAVLLQPDGPVGEVGWITVLVKWVDAALLAGLTAYLLLRNRISPAAFGIRTGGLGVQSLWGLATLLAAGVYVVSSAVVIFALLGSSPEFQQDLSKRVDFVQAMPVHDLARSLLLLSAVAIHEELLFRALLLPYLRRLLGSWWLAVLLSSAVFALLHLQQGLIGVVQVAGMAVLLAVVFILSRSVLAVILAHFLYDLAIFQALRYVLPHLENFPPPP
jgi:membrane protease YdiL (CAAX protease family)